MGELVFVLGLALKPGVEGQAWVVAAVGVVVVAMLLIVGELLVVWVEELPSLDIDALRHQQLLGRVLRRWNPFGEREVVCWVSWVS